MYFSCTLSRLTGTKCLCIAQQKKSESRSNVVVFLSYACFLLTQENDPSASVLPTGTARTSRCSRMFGGQSRKACYRGFSRLACRHVIHFFCSILAMSAILLEDLVYNNCSNKSKEFVGCLFSLLRRYFNSRQIVSKNRIATVR